MEKNTQKMNVQNIPLDMFEKDEQSYDDADKITRPSVTYWSDAWRRFRRNKLAMMSAIILILIVALAIIVPMVSRYTYNQNDLTCTN